MSSTKADKEEIKRLKTGIKELDEVKDELDYIKKFITRDGDAQETIQLRLDKLDEGIKKIQERAALIGEMALNEADKATLRASYQRIEDDFETSKANIKLKFVKED